MTSPALLRIARCRHPKYAVLSTWHYEQRQQHCTDCGSERTAQYECTWLRWTRPKLVADLIAEKKGKGK